MIVSWFRDGVIKPSLMSMVKGKAQDLTKKIKIKIDQGSRLMWVISAYHIKVRNEISELSFNNDEE